MRDERGPGVGVVVGRVVGGVLLGLYVLAAAIVVLSPRNPIRGIDLSRQLDALGLGWVTYVQLEIAANVAFFIPIGLLVGLLVPLRRWGFVVVGVLGVPLAIELAQSLLPNRVASLSDVLANITGGFLGLGLAGFFRLIGTGVARLRGSR